MSSTMKHCYSLYEIYDLLVDLMFSEAYKNKFENTSNRFINIFFKQVEERDNVIRSAVCWCVSIPYVFES